MWYTGGRLYTSRHKYRFSQKSYFLGILVIIFGRFGFFKVFQAFFLHALRYQFQIWYTHLVGGVTRQVRVSFQSRHFALLYSQKEVNFLHSWPQKWYRSLRFGAHTYIVSVLTPYRFSSWLGNFWPSGRKKHSEGAVSRASKKFEFTFHQNGVPVTYFMFLA